MKLKLSQEEMKIAIQGYLSQAVFSKTVNIGNMVTSGYSSDFEIDVSLDLIEPEATDAKGGAA